MIKAAGILIVSKTGKILFLKRGPGSDYPEIWAFPGGRVEDGEETIDGAIRETMEEAGLKVNARNLLIWTRSVAPATTPDGHEVDFTTYILRDQEEFIPVLGPVGAPEHTAYQWADIGSWPEPLHPGCMIALAKMSPDWNELSVAQAVQAKQLSSPQKYENITFFDMRITATEQAFRSEKRDDKGKVVQEAELVWRDPSLYMTPEFLARCNGLPVILEHPPGSSLDTEEFRERIIGTIMLPYLKEAEKEVWGVARIMDEPAAEMMTREQLSTSPAVVWSDPDMNHAGTFEDGKKFLIEGKPSLLDHLAVCYQGVWDKGRGPTGISTTRGDSQMTDDELKKMLETLLESNKKTDTLMVGLSEGLKAQTTRMDSFQKRFDEEDEKAKKDRKDRLDSFNFSKRKDGESDDELNKRHDAEESKLCADWEEEGESKEMAADKAKKRRDEFKKEEKNANDAAAKDADKGEEPGDENEDNVGEGKKSKDSKKDAKDEDDDGDGDDKKDRKDKRKDSRMDDDSRHDSVSRADYEALKKQVEDLKGLTKPVTDEELNAFGKVRARADSIFMALGQESMRPHAGESLLLYRRRVAGELKKNTKYAKSELGLVAADAATFDIIEGDIYKEAEEFSKSPARLKPGELRMRTIRADSGHIINEFDGDTDSWMRRFAGPVKQAVKVFNINNKRN